MRLARREKVFGPGPRLPLDREAKIRVMAFAAAWSARHRQPGQHKGPLTRAFLEVLEALLWGFHNAHTGACFPSYESIAAKAGCARSTVAEAVKALEWAGVLTWQNRIIRISERCADLFGQRGGGGASSGPPTPTCSATRRENGGFRPVSSKSENPTGTLNQDLSSDLPVRAGTRPGPQRAPGTGVGPIWNGNSGKIAREWERSGGRGVMKSVGGA